MFETNEFEHTFGANLDYGFNWKSKGWLEQGEEITSSAWIIPDTISKSREQHLNGVTSVWITGCEEGKMYHITNVVTTSEGRTDSRTIVLICKKR